MLTPRAIALQGAGYGRLFLALQGFVRTTVQPPGEPVFYGSGPGATLSMSEFLRLGQPARALPAAPQRPTRKEREREEFFLLFSA